MENINIWIQEALIGGKKQKKSCPYKVINDTGNKMFDKEIFLQIFIENVLSHHEQFKIEIKEQSSSVGVIFNFMQSFVEKAKCVYLLPARLDIRCSPILDAIVKNKKVYLCDSISYLKSISNLPDNTCYLTDLAKYFNQYARENIFPEFYNELVIPSNLSSIEQILFKQEACRLLMNNLTAPYIPDITDIFTVQDAVNIVIKDLNLTEIAIQCLHKYKDDLVFNKKRYQSIINFMQDPDLVKDYETAIVRAVSDIGQELLVEFKVADKVASIKLFSGTVCAIVERQGCFDHSCIDSSKYMKFLRKLGILTETGEARVELTAAYIDKITYKGRILYENNKQ